MILYLGSAQVCSSVVPSADERNEWLETFYRGVAFPTFARVLLLDVASDWLSCFPISVQKHLYDKFFLDGSVIEVVQVLVPFLHHVGDGGVNANSVQTNVERYSKTHFCFGYFLCSFPLSFCLRNVKHKSMILQQQFLLHDILHHW
jgi:hypothetical protein